MSLLTQTVGFVLVSLVVINGLIGGGVVDAIGTFATDEEKEQARLDLMCGLGYLLFTPATDVYGVDVPSPSYTNVIIAALITLSAIMIVRITTSVKWSFKYTIYMFVGVWIGIKVLGFILMQMSGPDCVAWAEMNIDKTSGFYEIAAIGGSLWGVRLLWNLRK